ncbi:MerR family transcriptional regulator [Actinomadura spongiicola]|uniref:MerR family transcriptional regulator n=1 Tax=Actinomadura spongiicola TaxID=2303421 RepID=A0A372GQ52_9ACTN|nr:MerR family transcriptional regulator [Actinomadura spongiicola]RFS87282.1 MerR family transcriptional regulator [Actinomadura spongiicola]
MNDRLGVSIGRAAALFDLAPSTLRWWEAQRVLPEPPRVNGRRVYTETELRRIGLAYLCCVTGAMSLEQTAVVTSDSSSNERWRSTVKRHTELIEERIEKLRTTREYLLVLLECPDDDIVAECPHLDGELTRHTPRGSVPAQDLVAAARSTPRRRPAREGRDEKESTRDEKPEPQSRCAVCAEPLTQPSRGRRRRFCSRACRQRHYRARSTSGHRGDGEAPFVSRGGP